MDKKEVSRLNRFAKQIRLNTVRSLDHLGFGHYGGALSIVETLAVLYDSILNIDPDNPQLASRDYFILSKGHAGPALYAALALRGYFGLEMLDTLNQNGTNLPSHPDRNLTPGVDMTTGSLGQGISVACGVAKSFQIDQKDQYVYCMIGDGELNEGQCWEAFQFASHNQLDHLVVFLDENKKQLDGLTEQISGGNSYSQKFKAFGFDTRTVDGGDVEAIYDAIMDAKAVAGRPHMIILDTIKGQGFPYLETLEANHHLRPTAAEDKIIKEYIKQLEHELGGEANA